MSKRLYTRAKWKAHSRERQRDELQKLRRNQRSRSETDLDAQKRESQRSLRKKHRRPYSTIKAPSNFSIVQNAEETIQFLHEIEIISRTHHIALDLANVESLTTDGVAALIATLRKAPIRSTTSVRGNHPNTPRAREMLMESGFFSHVVSEQPIKIVKGKISEKQSKKVEPETARDLIHVATEALSGVATKSRPAYRALIECMNNTRNHASGRHDYQETWWATAYADVARNRACYTFLDTGVGIFRSVRIGKLRKLFKFAGIKTDADILSDILLGRVESSTGQPFRGKGLPAIYRLCQIGSIKSLVLVANDVYARVEAGEYRQMRTSFSGTLLYWEV
jgi:hypothetical protein